MAGAETGGARDLLGVVLAGGAGRRIGGDKAAALLAGRPLSAWVTDALSEVAAEVVVAVKPGHLASFVGGAAVWEEPAVPVHPLAGIAWALERAGGRAVLVCAVDLPLCGPAVRAVVAAAGDGVAGSGGAEASILIAEGQPLLGLYRPAVAPELRAAVEEGRPARATVAALGAVVVPVPEPGRTLFNVNTAEDLARAEALVAAGCGSTVPRAPPPPR